MSAPARMPSADVLLRHIEAQTCPWCFGGPYRVLANHAVKAHGVTGAAMRKAAGLTVTARISSPEHVDTMREFAADNARTLAVNLAKGRSADSPARQKGVRSPYTSARMAAIRRLVEIHRDDYDRLYREERRKVSHAVVNTPMEGLMATLCDRCFRDIDDFDAAEVETDDGGIAILCQVCVAEVYRDA